MNPADLEAREHQPGPRQSTAAWCHSCGREIGPYDGATCGPCADDDRDARDERQEWWG